MKNIVLVPRTLAGIPCANLPISLPNECHAFFYFGLVTSCLYSNNFPMSSSRIAPANLVFVEDWPRCIILFSTAAYMHSCVIVACHVFDFAFAAGPSTSVSWLNDIIGIGCGETMLSSIPSGAMLLLQLGVTLDPQN